jgi:Glycosyl transferases group 1
MPRQFVKPLVGIAVTPPQYDTVGRYGLHVARNYAAAFARLGFEPVLVELGGGDPTAIGCLLRPQVALLFSHGGWLMTPDGPRAPGIRAALNAADKPTIVIIGDAPYVPWLAPIFANLPPRAVPFFVDPSFADGIAHWIASGRSAVCLPVTYLLDSHGPVPTKDKTIPLLFVGKTLDADRFRDDVRTTRPQLLRSFDALIEANLADLDRPLTQVAAEVLPALGAVFDMDDRDIRQVLYLADRYIRQKRRNTVLDKLFKYPALIVSPGTAALPPGSKATLLPGRSFPEVLELLRRAAVTVVCQPHYPGALNERIVHAMQARSVVIATPNPRTSQLFLHGRDLFTTAPDVCNIDDLIDTARRPDIAESMRDHAMRRIAEKHRPENMIRHMLTFMASNGLLDGLPHVLNEIEL